MSNETEKKAEVSEELQGAFEAVEESKAVKGTGTPKADARAVCVRLGSRYRCRLHGVEGFITCKSEYLNGCHRACLEYVKDGEVKEYWLDQTQLEEVKEKEADVATPELPKTGGPRSAPAGLSTPR